VYGLFDDAVERSGVVDTVPGVFVGQGAAYDNEEPDSVGHVCGDDDDADDEEADEAGFGGVAGSDETDELAAVAVEAVGQEH
jgi:hypothetical protein